jgi:phosphate/sulfate permease
MAALPQFTYIFVIGLFFAFLDAWNIGANDVANAFATSVSSRSLTLIQAMAIGAIMEFTGAVLAGYVRTVATIVTIVASRQNVHFPPDANLVLQISCLGYHQERHHLY